MKFRRKLLLENFGQLPLWCFLRNLSDMAREGFQGINFSSKTQIIEELS
jgi:hypothetical protein